MGNNHFFTRENYVKNRRVNDKFILEDDNKKKQNKGR